VSASTLAGRSRGWKSRLKSRCLRRTRGPSKSHPKARRLAVGARDFRIVAKSPARDRHRVGQAPPAPLRVNARFPMLLHVLPAVPSSCTRIFRHSVSIDMTDALGDLIGSQTGCSIRRGPARLIATCCQRPWAHAWKNGATRGISRIRTAGPKTTTTSHGLEQVAALRHPDHIKTLRLLRLPPP